MRSLEARTELVEQFVAARTRLAEGKVADAMAQCETMIGAFISNFWLFLPILAILVIVSVLAIRLTSCFVSQRIRGRGMNARLASGSATSTP